MQTSRITRFRRRPSWTGGGKRSEAIALKYDPETDRAPTVLAKGRGPLADAIIERAEASGVPVITDQVTLESLRFVEVGEEIPPQVYHMVAEVLAFVYSLGERPKHRP